MKQEKVIIEHPCRVPGHPLFEHGQVRMVPQDVADSLRRGGHLREEPPAPKPSKKPALPDPEV